MKSAGTGNQRLQRQQGYGNTPYQLQQMPIIPPSNPAVKVTTDKDTNNPLTNREVWQQSNDERATYMQNAMALNKHNGWLNLGVKGTQMVGNMMNNIFTHVVNMKQLTNHAKFMWYQHDISKRGLALEDKKLDVTKEMQGEQLKYQLQVARYQKETAVTVAAIQQKGKTKRVQALAALRGFYNQGKPASPFQRVMT